VSDSRTYGAFRPERDIEPVARAIALAFGGTEAGAREWLDATGHRHGRVLRDAGGGVAASLLALPMGQYFGGRVVPMQGIAGVAVAPERRGRGLALEMMRRQVREAAEQGVALSCLYASTQALYRQAGYEQAGLLFRTSIPLRTIGVRERGLELRELSADDDGAIRACYAQSAARVNGALERGAYEWSRVRKMRDEAYTGFGVFAPEAPGRLESYLFMTQRRKPETGRHDVGLSDLVFTTSRAGRRLLGFLSDLATVGDDAIVYGGPLHPICALMPQQYHTSRFVDVWMLRINLVEEALVRRGYGRGVDTGLSLEITDELVPENAGRWTLRVRGGGAAVERGGSGPTLRCSVRGLAPVYAGYLTAAQAGAAGLVEGDAEAISAADAVFAGPTPWMSDRF